MAIAGRTDTRRRTADWSKRTKEAIALSFDPDKDDAPVVVARGRGRTAEKIVETAREHDVAVVSDEVALEALSIVDVGDQVPPQVYHMVAEILAFVYNLGDRPRHDT